MLDTTLATEFVPGTNVKGEVAGANWLFLLPSLELERVVWVGDIAPASLAALARLSREVVVCTTRAAVVRKVEEFCGARRLANVRTLGNLLALPAGSADLLLLADEGVDLLASEKGAADLRRVLREGGLIYFEQKGAGHDRAARRIAGLSGGAQTFWLTPLSGEMHTAVPEQDRATGDYFLRHGLVSRSVNLGALKRAVRANLPSQPAANGAAPSAPARQRRGLKASVKRAVRSFLASVYSSAQGAIDGVEQRLTGTALLGGIARRYGVLAGAGLTDQPPRYLREIAGAAGVDIDRHRWGLSARGEYSSRKVLVFLFNRAGDDPEYIVKMTRDAALNPRLENEYRALRLLEHAGIGDRETLPRVAFFGHHGGLAVLGETIVEGAPFEQRASGKADCAYAQDAINWLTDLGARTADRAVASPDQVAAALGRLFARFAEIYRLDPAHHAFLSAQIAAIAESADPFPLVFQHGDPGTWNAMVAPSGRTAFLDWEAAEPHGMPLWDLFYFVRTYGAWAMRAAVSGEVTKGFASQFLADTPFQSLLIGATRRYCAQLGLPEQYVEPLFYTCWMHRALKESTRLPAGALERGHYVSVLRASIDQRDTLAPLFSAVAHV